MFISRIPPINTGTKVRQIQTLPNHYPDITQTLPNHYTNITLGNFWLCFSIGWVILSNIWEFFSLSEQISPIT